MTENAISSTSRHGLLALTETFEKWMSEEPITDGEMYDALMAGIEIAKAAM